MLGMAESEIDARRTEIAEIRALGLHPVEVLPNGLVRCMTIMCADKRLPEFTQRNAVPAVFNPDHVVYCASSPEFGYVFAVLTMGQSLSLLATMDDVQAALVEARSMSPAFRAAEATRDAVQAMKPAA